MHCTIKQFSPLLTRNLLVYSFMQGFLTDYTLLFNNNFTMMYFAENDLGRERSQSFPWENIFIHFILDNF